MASISMELAGVYVQASKKGKAPVLVEKRPKGKVVTIISNINPPDGGPKQLLSLLKHRLGCGGLVVAGGGSVELQGSHEEAAVQLLNQYKLLKGIAGTGKNAERKETQPDVPMFKREDWSCYNCGTMNLGDRSACSKCASFRKWSEQQRELDAQGVIRPTAAAIGAPVKKRAPHWCPVDWLYCTGFCNTETEDSKVNGEGCWSNWDDCICAELEIHENADSRRGRKRSFADESSFEALMTLGMIACKFVGEYDRTQKKPKTQKAKKTEQEEKKATLPSRPSTPVSGVGQFKNYTPPVVYQPAAGRPRPVQKKPSGGGGGGAGADKGVRGAGMGGGGRSFRFGNARYETDADEYYYEEYEEEEEWQEDWPEPKEPVAVGWTADSPAQPSSSSSSSSSSSASSSSLPTVDIPSQSADDVFEGYNAEEQAMIAAALGLSKQDTKEKTMIKLAMRLSMEQHQREQEFREQEFRAEIGDVAEELAELSLPEQKTQAKKPEGHPQDSSGGWVPLPTKARNSNNPAANGRTSAPGPRPAWVGAPIAEEFPSLSATRKPATTTVDRSRGPLAAQQFPALATAPRQKTHENFAKVAAKVVVQHEFPALPTASRRRASQEDIFARPRSAPPGFPSSSSTKNVHPTQYVNKTELSPDADLDKALRLSLEEERKQQQLIAKQIEEEKQSASIMCPVGCGKRLQQTQLNQHVDECLNMAYIHTHSNPNSSSSQG